MTKKALANMWWIIVGAILALVVMVVLLVMFTGSAQKVEGGLLSCEGKGGDCVDKDTCKTVHKGTVFKIFECSDDRECCFGVRSGE